MNKELVHIFDKSTCLTKKQMKDYISCAMNREECHAAEVHISCCPFCSEAVDGMMLQPGEAVEVLAELNTNFIKEHFHEIMPQIHLNSITATATVTAPSRKNKKVHYLWQVSSVAAALLIVFGLIWYFDSGKNNREIASSSTNRTEQYVEKPQPAKQQIISKPTAAQSVAATVAQPTELKNNNRETNSGKNTIASDRLIATKSIASIPSSQTKKETIQDTAALKSISTGEATIAKNEEDDKNKNLSIAQTQTLAYSTAPAYKQQPFDVAAIHTDRFEAKKTVTKNNFSEDAIKTGDALYESKNYKDAINQYSREINDEDIRRRHEAMFKSAQCYIAINNPSKAKELLKKIIDEGGAQKHAAKSLLKKMNE